MMDYCEHGYAFNMLVHECLLYLTNHSWSQSGNHNYEHYG